jgi:hypothetical protein
MVGSFMTSRCFNSETLFNDYQFHYSNVVDVGLTTEKSIEEEFALPINVDYFDPQPVCVCPDLGEENLTKIAETASRILRNDKQMNNLIDHRTPDYHEGGQKNQFNIPILNVNGNH